MRYSQKCPLWPTTCEPVFSALALASPSSRKYETHPLARYTGGFTSTDAVHRKYSLRPTFCDPAFSALALPSSPS